MSLINVDNRASFFNYPSKLSDKGIKSNYLIPHPAWVLIHDNSVYVVNVVTNSSIENINVKKSSLNLTEQEKFNILVNFSNKIYIESKDLDPDIAQIVNDNLWDIL